ncbi:hypothetical protein CR513_22367, partial [Mucuna pruriens]
MSSTSQFFHSYNPYPSNRKIMVAYGFVATVAEVGDIYISLTIILKDVSHVPKLSVNLVSIKKLTNDLNCYVISSNKDIVWLHHLHLGRSSFNILKLMFPQLFQGLDVCKFHCDICELARHTRVPFPSSNKRSVHPFDLVHSDVWRPFVVPSISRAWWFLSIIDDCTLVT